MREFINSNREKMKDVERELEKREEAIKECDRIVRESSSTFYSESYIAEELNDHWLGATGVELHKAIGIYLAGVYTKKNSDYGDAFGKSIDKHGMEDKLGRLDALTSGTDQQVFDEKLEDTVLDLANYAIMTAMYMIEKGR
ncbi:TPA: DUF1599 domain-containing protein [Escherichia coli]|nr:DUF1599 domain-containing protein [Escherichia coli]